MSKKDSVPEPLPDILPGDSEFRRGITNPDDKEEYAAYWAFQKLMGEQELPPVLTFYYVPGGPGWVLCTLKISSASRRQSASTPDRYYGIGVKDGKTYTVGRGPHVTKVVEVYFRRENWDRLEAYAQMWKKGMADAGSIRDRISSRRAQGQAHRVAGRTHWSW